MPMTKCRLRDLTEFTEAEGQDDTHHWRKRDERHSRDIIEKRHARV